MMNALETASTRPYLIRALHEWCSDAGLTPYIAVLADDTVQVPREYVQNGEIVLNVSLDATSALELGNDLISFKARFGGVPRDIMVPVDRVIAIYARESGQGMAFPMVVSPPTSDQDATDAPSDAALQAAGPRSGVQLVSAAASAEDGEPEPPSPARKRPSLKIVK